MPLDLRKYKYTELKNIALNLGLNVKKNKEKIISLINEVFIEYENYKKERIDRYKKIKIIGNKGKEGITYLVVDTQDSSSEEYAMKTFKKSKSSNRLKKEYSIQKIAGKIGVAPRVYDYDTVSKYIIMDKMDRHLYEKIDETGGLSKKHQKRIVEIFLKLDEAKIFHDDSNICNYMLKEDEVYLIDYGQSKYIDSGLIKKLGTSHPNIKMGLIGFVLVLKNKKLPESSYKYLLKNISTEDQIKYKL